MRGADADADAAQTRSSGMQAAGFGGGLLHGIYRFLSCTGIPMRRVEFGTASTGNGVGGRERARVADTWLGGVRAFFLWIATFFLFLARGFVGGKKVACEEGVWAWRGAAVCGEPRRVGRRMV